MGQHTIVAADVRLAEKAHGEVVTGRVLPRVAELEEEVEARLLSLGDEAVQEVGRVRLAALPVGSNNGLEGVNLKRSFDGCAVGEIRTSDGSPGRSKITRNAVRFSIRRQAICRTEG